MSSHFPELPLFEIGDKTYTYSNLGHKEVFSLIALAKDWWSMGMGDFKLRFERFEDLLDISSDLAPDAVFKLALAFGSEFIKVHLDKLFISILKEVKEDGTRVDVTQGDLEDPCKFPAFSLVTLLTRLIAHPDISMFVSAFQEGLDLPFFQKLINSTPKSQNT